MESHFQGLEESSYLVEGENTHLKKIFLSKACQQSKMGGKNERHTRENGTPSFF